MPYFKPSKSSIHLIARAFLVEGEKVVLCRVKGKDWFFLPGGHIENGEPAATALLRELNEEIGPNDYYISSFIGICENIFSLNEKTLQHEVNMIFKVDLGADFKIAGLEDDIEFITVKKKELENLKILPGPIKEGMLEWLETGRVFFKALR
ncbi:MAG: NUDIX domain-containing protein [Candidatus Paceibacterota bacterium]|jgi:ADP-ribose pyrophosphatase YjhB (NUDIX family)